jgi:hypothetical protein
LLYLFDIFLDLLKLLLVLIVAVVDDQLRKIFGNKKILLYDLIE